jgi:hypothetical protein
MSDAQQRMRSEYQEMRVPIFIPTFKSKAKIAAEAGLLLFIKYALVLLLTYIAFTFGTQIVNGSINGTQSALYLNELQNKGYLPKVVNGSIPSKEEVRNETLNSK